MGSESFEDSEDRESVSEDFTPCALEPFVLNYMTKEEDIGESFERWLDAALAAAVKEFGSRLRKRATLEDIRKHGHMPTPGRYVGTEAAEDDGEPFEEKMKRLTATLRERQAEAAKPDAAINASLQELGYGR